MSMSSSTKPELYSYSPSHVLPSVFSALVGISLVWHVYQNFHYKFWRITFFLVWAGLVFTSGWITRTVSSYNTTFLPLYISQYVLIYAGPPIYAAAEYNILGRLMHYLPMHSPLHPHRVTIVFIYLGALVESLTAAGASMMAENPGNIDKARVANRLISISLVLQGAVEIIFAMVVITVHRRAKRTGMLTRNVKKLCIMLYGTSSLIVLRCVFRAVEAFSTAEITSCNSVCRVATREWYLFAFEAAPMVVYTYWLNFMHPGKLIPRQRLRYLDVDGKTERVGPGWIDRRSKWETFVDPLDITGLIKGQPSHDKFWERPDEWPVADAEGYEKVPASVEEGHHARY